ncbi:MAG: gliding motility-associated ABC transporter substrate-binding protein GldG, partial [Verrucomicrobia bacterium]|nr:gliding motility-associated ABC transporter substrate-binding protein GldG [Cytophagales bacterium]
MKQKSLLFFVVLLAVVLLVNLISSFFFFRIDLTSDKRYTISAATEQLLSKIEDEVSVVVYLDGELPSGFKRLRTSVEEQLAAFSAQTGGKIAYSFADPSQISDPKARNKFYTELAGKGIQPTNLFNKQQGGGKTERIIFPGALVSYKGKEVPVSLLKGTKGTSPEQILNQSVENTEYELADAIRKLTVTQKPQIGILAGHGEPADIQLYDLITSLQSYYDVFRVPIALVPDSSLKNLDALLVIRPDTAYSETDKYKIDQFVVNGGKVLFFLDALKIGEISENGTLAMPQALNLEDLLFRYGVRLNQNMVKDLVSARIPMVTGNTGNQTQTQAMEYRYFPIVNTFAKHPITRNLDILYFKYASSIDTVKAKNIVKTPLFFTSPYSKILNAPVMVSYNDARRDPDPKTFKQGNIPLAYLLEGSFHSLFANRI